MKKKVFFILTILLVMSLFFINAAEDDVDTKAAACINAQIDAEDCDSLSLEEKIFTLLAIGECKNELRDESDDGECWPDTGCSVKTTAQAILAMKKTGTSTGDAEDWLLDQVADYSALDWFLQVESSTATSCTVEYGGTTSSFSINEDKTLSRDAGSCLDVYGNYWFRISSSCYDEEFKISCENSFLTSLLYKRTDASTFYVSGQTNSASGSGTTRETVGSSCFGKNGACDYEGTLWAATTLKYLGKNVTAYLPYLVSMAEDNQQYIPESFLFSLTGNYKNELLLKQQENKWWSASGDRFYDTAVALLPFQNSDISEKAGAKSWLIEIQDEDGCWQGNIRNTAIILYSLWPKTITISDDVEEENDCTDLGFYCLSNSACTSANGSVLSNYTGCFGTNVCCSKKVELQTCASQDGELCSSDEECTGGEIVSSSDSNSAKFCCVGGTCETVETECEINNGYCKTSCGSGEQVADYDCNSGVCCITKESNLILWIILLVVLIALTSLGIVFRKKLKDIFLRVKTKLQLMFKSKGLKSPKGKTPNSAQKLSQTPSSRVYPGAVQRSIIPNQQPHQVRKPVQNTSEFDDVLKKLKEIGK
jgi:hypothetical protein